MAASFDPEEARQVREGGIAPTGHLTELTVHHTNGSLMNLLFLYFYNLDTSWNIIHEVWSHE